MAVLRGDLRYAETRARAWYESSRARGDEAPLSEAARVLGYILIETAQREQVVRLAKEYDDTLLSSIRDPSFDSTFLAPLLLHLSSSLSDEAFEAARARWLRSFRERPPRINQEQTVWFIAYGLPIMSSDDAVRALEEFRRLPSFFDPLSRTAMHDLAVGRMFRRAGDLRSAREPLERAVRACASIWIPMEKTWATLELAELLAESDEPSLACTHVREVQRRWGSDTRSVTSAAANKLDSFLNCHQYEKEK